MTSQPRDRRTPITRSTSAAWLRSRSRSAAPPRHRSWNSARASSAAAVARTASDGLVADTASLDLRHGLLADAGPFRQFDLAPAQPSSQLAHEVPEAPIVHAPMVATGAYPATYVTLGAE